MDIKNYSDILSSRLDIWYNIDWKNMKEKNIKHTPHYRIGYLTGTLRSLLYHNRLSKYDKDMIERTLKEDEKISDEIYNN